MANALDTILQGAGDIAGGAYKGLRDWGRRYTYGPYYEENQQLRREQAKTSLEAYKARKEYYEYLKKHAEENAKNNPLQKQKLSDINNGIEVLEALRTNPANKDNPVFLNKVNMAMDKMLGYMNSLVNGQEQPLPTGNESSFVPPGVQYNWSVKTPEQRIGMMFNPTTNIPIEKKPAGALANVGPPLPSDYNRYVPPGVQSTWSAMTPQQRTAKIFGQPEISNVTAQASPPGLESIWNQLDEDSKQAAKQLLSQGATPQELVEHYRKKMGK